KRAGSLPPSHPPPGVAVALPGHDRALQLPLLDMTQYLEQFQVLGPGLNSRRRRELGGAPAGACSQRQAQPDVCAAARAGGDTGLAAVGTGDRLDDCEAEPAP